MPGDNSAVIQQAIDRVSNMKLVNGFRGAVLLKPGVYNCERELNINASGVALRGSGSGEKGTILNLIGKPAHLPCCKRGSDGFIGWKTDTNC